VNIFRLTHVPTCLRIRFLPRVQNAKHSSACTNREQVSLWRVGS